MGPVTNAGAIAQALAETMAGCALTQLERKGAPVIFGNFLSSMSLRSGSPTFGTPEPAIGSMVIGQLARRLNLPLRCAGNFSNSKLPDAQAMNEGTMSMLSAVHCGANFILHSAGFLDGLCRCPTRSSSWTPISAARCIPIWPASSSMTTRWRSMPSARLARASISLVAPTRWRTTRRPSGIRPSPTMNRFEKWDLAGRTDAASRANQALEADAGRLSGAAMDEATDEALVGLC
jgi:trimethylamine--corrinoid protein Co-methyltransferase